jgi:hypothetical protein
VYTSIEDDPGSELGVRGGWLLPLVKAMASKREHLVARAKERFAQAERDVTKQREIIELARSKGEDTEEHQSVLHKLLVSRKLLRQRLRLLESKSSSRDKKTPL